MTEWAHCLHEGRHVCATWLVGGTVESAAVGSHAPQEGIVRVAPLKNGAADLLTRLIGWMQDPHLPAGAMWPPPYPPPTGRGKDPDGVGWCVKHYGLSRETYDGVVEVAEKLLADGDFQRAVTLVARGLSAAPQIDAEGLEALRAATTFADEPDPIGAT